MNFDILDTLLSIAIMAPPVLFAVACHEVAHGYVAYRNGDNTAKSMVRLTLNPIRHIDPFGSIALPIMFYLTFGMPIGFAKPVPVNMSKLNNPRRDMAWVAVAGPATNFLLAFVSTFCLKLLSLFDSQGGEAAITLFVIKVFRFNPHGNTPPPELDSFIVVMGLFLIFSIWINLVLGVINLVPILPADGGRIFASFLPPEIAMKFVGMERWGLVLLFGLLILNPFNIISYTLLPILLYLFELFISII
jgi:Zn-dependent protease